MRVPVPLVFASAALVLGALCLGRAVEAPAPSLAPRDALIEEFKRAPNGTLPLSHATGETRAFTLEVREVTAEIAPGVKVKQWAFGLPGKPASVPGPELRVRRGDRVRITLRNTSGRAHTIHAHGITRLAQEMDGVPHTAKAVLPGESFTYEFVAAEAGTHMYHCHVETNLHLDMGMYGALIVEPPAGANAPWTKDHVLMLDEWDPKQGPDKLPHRPTPTHFLVNGRAHPLVPDLNVPAGETHLLRFLNIGGAVHSMHLHGMTFLVVAKDGQDLPLPHRADTVLIGPGERYDVLVKGRDGVFPLHDHIPHHGTNDGADPGGMHLMVAGGPALRADGSPAPAAHAHDRGAPPAAPLPLRTGTVEVPVKGFVFAPAALRVKKGAKVVWRNDDLAAHSVVVSGPKKASSLPLRKGGRFAVTFDAPGRHLVTCVQHPFMKATVAVEP